MTHRIHEREQALGDGEADHDVAARATHVHLRNVASLAHVVRVVLGVFGRTAHNCNIVVGFLAAVLGLESELPYLGTDDINRLDVVADCLRIGQRHRRPFHRLAALFFIGETDRPFLYLKRL